MIDADRNNANTIETLIDHGSITEEQKKVAENILEIIKTNTSNNIPLKFSISQIENDYKIAEIPMMRVEDSLWHQFTKDEKIGCNIQGYRTISKDDKKIRIPYVAFGADLEYLNEMMTRIVLKIQSLKVDK